MYVETSDMIAIWCHQHIVCKKVGSMPASSRFSSMEHKKAFTNDSHEGEPWVNPSPLYRSVCKFAIELKQLVRSCHRQYGDQTCLIWRRLVCG